MSESLAVVTSSFPIRGDGSEAAGSFVADTVDELSKSLPIRVVAPGPTTAREHWTDRLEVFRYAAPSQPLSTLKPWRPADFRSIVRVLRAGLAATRAAAATGVPASHILALWGLPCGEWARRVACENGIAYSVWLLGSDVWTLGRIPILRGRLARVIREAACAYADGYKLADDARRIARAPVTFLPSTRRIGMSDPPPPRAQPPYRLLFLGRWHPNKGVDLLLDALAMLDDDNWKSIESVAIQGGGPMEPLVRQRADGLRAAGRPVVAGRFLTKPEAEDAIVQADWVLIPSRIESIPVIFSDAMKLGRPVIATPVGDLPAILKQNRCGVIAETADALAYRRALAVSLNAPSHMFTGEVATEALRFDLRTVAGTLLGQMLTHG